MNTFLSKYLKTASMAKHHSTAWVEKRLVWSIASLSTWMSFHVWDNWGRLSLDSVNQLSVTRFADGGLKHTNILKCLSNSTSLPVDSHWSLSCTCLNDKTDWKCWNCFSVQKFQTARMICNTMIKNGNLFKHINKYSIGHFEGLLVLNSLFDPKNTGLAHYGMNVAPELKWVWPPPWFKPSQL